MIFKFHDWVMYEGRSYQYFDDCDDGMIALEDTSPEAERLSDKYVHCYQHEVSFVRHADDATFELGAHI